MIYDMKVLQGADHSESFTLNVLLDPLLPYDPNTNPYITLDTTGFTGHLEVRTNYDDPNPILSLVLDDGISILNGILTISFTAASTSAIQFKGATLNAVYQIELYQGPYTYRPVWGKFILCREVVR